MCSTGSGHLRYQALQDFDIVTNTKMLVYVVVGISALLYDLDNLSTISEIAWNCH